MKTKPHPKSRKPVWRILVIWAIESLALFLMSLILDGFQLNGFGAAVIAAAIIGLLNALLWPLLSYIILPFAVLTLGIAALILNGVIIYLAGELSASFEVASVGTAIWIALGLTAVNAIASSLLTIDDDNSYYRNVVKRRAKKIAKPEETDKPGIIFLEIDGLARPVLEKAMAAGYAANMKRWLDSGDYELVEWETDMSSQTSASQLGILHGSNKDIPAFRWYDRKRKTIVASSNPDEVARLEKEHSDGNGLLVEKGASRGNLVSGDAPIVSVTASVMKDFSRLHMTDYYAYFANPYNITRTMLLMGWDIILEKWQFRQARKKNVVPIMDKHHRGGKYPLLRVFTTIIMRELNVYTLIGDMFGGVKSAYATFVGYDEVAHHSGVESLDALDILRKLDEQFARLESVAADAARPYHLVVLSDHGQSGGPTFKQRYGLDLQELVQQHAKQFLVQGFMETNESWGHVNVVVNDVMKSDKKSGRWIKRLAGKNVKDGEVQVGEEELADDLKPEANIIVLASGNLGLVYGTKRDTRITLEEVDKLFPGLLDNLVQHEGIGWVMVQSSEYEGVVVGKNGRYYLNDDRVEGDNPLAGFGPNAARHLKRYNQFPDAPDLYINSFYNVETNEVAAFEELIGCHGGMGGYQTRPFILHPKVLPITEPELVGADSVYRQFKHWLAEVQGAPLPAPAGD
ncbi:MAG TPA: phage holin family protein [Chloroflexota bacterium]|nr:phage holin family protein [Chloroflexota bacterium]